MYLELFPLSIPRIELRKRIIPLEFEMNILRRESTSIISTFDSRNKFCAINNQPIQRRLEIFHWAQLELGNIIGDRNKRVLGPLFPKTKRCNSSCVGIIRHSSRFTRLGTNFGDFCDFTKVVAAWESAERQQRRNISELVWLM